MGNNSFESVATQQISPEPSLGKHSSPNNRPPSRRIGALALGVMVLCAVVVFTGFGVFSDKVTTDDAQVDGHITSVSPRISGYVDKVAVNDNEHVEAGDLLVRIDPRDYQAEVDQATAAYHGALARAQSAKVAVHLTRDTVASAIQSSLAAEAASGSELLRSQESQQQAANAALKAAEAAVEAKRAINGRSQADLARYRPLLATADISQLKFDAVQATAQVSASELALAEQRLAEARKGVDIAKAQTAAATAQLDRSRALVRQSRAKRQEIQERNAQYHYAMAEVGRARAKVNLAKLRLSYTEIRAPISGVVTQKTVQLGDRVSPGQLLLTIVPLDQVYITANFKETQLAGVHPGQRAVIQADMYSGVTFEGTVDSISGAAGSRQALLPPQNATGNFVKVVQRVPVKILLKRTVHPNAVLRPGTNVRASIYVR